MSVDAVEAILQVEENGAPRSLSVDDLKTGRTGAATEATLASVVENARFRVLSVDASPALSGFAAIGMDIVPGESVLVSGGGGVMLDVGFWDPGDGTAEGVMWLGFGVSAVEGAGLALRPGGTLEGKWTADDLHVLLVGPTSQRVIGQRWAT